MKRVTEGILPMLWFKCCAGHFTCCRTGMQIIFCKKCHKLIPKKECERYTDSHRPNKTYKKGVRVAYEGKTLYKFTESTKRDYRKNPTANKRKRAAAKTEVITA